MGSHIGTFSICAAEKLKKGAIHAIEACKESYNFLEKNILENKLSNIKCHNIALADHTGTTKLYYNIRAGNWGHSISKKLSDQYEEVPAETLENFILNNNISCCDFLRLNCEGAEFSILLNTPKEILQKIKLILVLYHEDLDPHYTKEDLFTYLRLCGFKITLRDKTRQRGWLIAQGIKYKLSWHEYLNVYFKKFMLHMKIFKRKFTNKFIHKTSKSNLYS